MTYQEKIKASKEVLTAIQAMKDGEVLEFVYGTERDWKTEKEVPVLYELRCRVGYRGQFDYSVSDPGSYAYESMNVDKVSKTAIKLYSYNMMKQRSSYTIPLYEMKIGVTITESIN